MFGYASNETDVLMPAPVTFAHRLSSASRKCAKGRHPELAAPGCQIPGYLPL